MKALVIPFAVWAGVLGLQAPMTLEGAGSLLSTAGGLAGLTVMVYRLGVWRQEMVNTKNNVAAEVTRLREEWSRDFRRLEDRLTSIDRFIAATTEQRVATERWQSKVDAVLDTERAA